MYFDQYCLLCLEKVSPTNNSININSDDSESVNMWNIIEQHFKEEIFTMPTLSNQIVCKKCWELLKSFHEFYNQVTQAHLQARHKLKALQELEITVTDIKEEPDAVDKLALQELAEITVTEVKVEPDVVDTLASSPVAASV
ncbi:transcription factor grauzone-like isoform X2 [Bactrocera dorsalis]|uniref:Transcription factor grauzone-like isoform X2 n=1 Tax=Bactrocera dorsalis TaxID=27457 RepID=A0ABM3JEW8_BACDO|nr:transcription factor grauzone-like isoform X2 [Bactrocera dorsalis]